MKVAILNDTHFGVKNGSDVFLDYMERFFMEEFFPYCESNGITTILHLGDYYDHRKMTNIKVMKRSREMFIEELLRRNMTLHMVPGNHDTYFKNTNDVCSLTELLSRHRDINICMKPTILNLDGLDIALLPWITEDNQEECMEFIQSAAAPILMGHLELEGFRYLGNADIKSHGMDHRLFSRYEMVLSGHYHTPSTRDNVTYLGTQYQLTWSDINDLKGFHVLDTGTRRVAKVANPHRLFFRLEYNDEAPTTTVVPPEIRGGFVRVIVAEKKDPELFEKFIDTVQAYEPFDLKIVESFEDLAGGSISDDDIASLDDTSQLINSYVDATTTDLDKERLKVELQALLSEAQNSDAV